MGKLKFAADRTLGRLAKWLRILGFDTEFFMDNQELISAAKNGRIVLTRNTKLMISLRHCVFLDSNNPDDQLKGLFDLLHLKVDSFCFFSRCTQCNARVHPVEKTGIRGDVPNYVWSTQSIFYKCPRCGKIYWKGTHVEKFQKRFEKLMGSK